MISGPQQPSTRYATRHGSAKRVPARRFGVLRVLVALLLLLLLVAGIPLVACSSSSGPDTSSTSFDIGSDTTLSDRDADSMIPPEARIIRVSFAAVGDNLIHGSVYRYGQRSDGSYNFDMLYAPVAPYIEEVDIAFMNQETVCGGTELGLADYPCFNSPKEILDAVYYAGFDWINTASNHSMDAHDYGIISQLDHIATLPGLVQTGTHSSWEDFNTPTVIEVSGVRIGLASYTYGLNGFILPDGEEYLVDLIDIEKITSDIEKLKEVSDVQIVNMHWGDEYQYYPNDEQQYLAQYLADLGVDVVIGEHPHVVQPTTMLTGAGGNKTLTIYSLGNFMSAQDEPPRMLGEMARWVLCYDPLTKEVSFENVEIWPLVTHYVSGWTGFESYALRDYTNELAATHSLSYKGLSREFLINLSREVFGDEFTLVY